MDRGTLETSLRPDTMAHDAPAWVEGAQTTETPPAVKPLTCMEKEIVSVKTRLYALYVVFVDDRVTRGRCESEKEWFV